MTGGPRLRPATILAQLDHFTDPATGAFVPPLQLGVTGTPAPGDPVASQYARSGSPATLLVESVMTWLDGGEAALAFASATAAMGAMLSVLRPGDHLLVDSGAYYEFTGLMDRFGKRWNVAVDRADLTDPAAVRAALHPGRTRLVWAECPSNPLWRVPDIAALASQVQAAGARLLVDATVATPVLLQPLRLGADYVLHSATKYLNGHSDVLAGVLVARQADDAFAALSEARTDGGTVLPPFGAWLLLRGLRTLAIRMERVSVSAARIAAALLAHGAVTEVHYPGLPSDPWHGAARRQFTGAGFGGMVSFRSGATEADAIALCARFRLFRRATSLGSAESLVEHRRTTEGPASSCPPTLIRLSLGLEDADDLLADLAQALA